MLVGYNLRSPFFFFSLSWEFDVDWTAGSSTFMDAVHDLRRADEFASDLTTGLASDLKTQAEAPSRQIVDATVVRHNVVRVPPPLRGSGLDF